MERRATAPPANVSGGGAASFDAEVAERVRVLVRTPGARRKTVSEGVVPYGEG